jgi:hypothetical protein
MMTSGLMTPQGSDLSQSFRARGETRSVDPAEERRRSLAATESHVRVAALLSAISRNNRYEGRDPAIIPDCFSSGFVADLLGLSVSHLADALVELKRRGLVREPPSGCLICRRSKAWWSPIDQPQHPLRPSPLTNHISRSPLPPLARRTAPAGSPRVLGRGSLRTCPQLRALASTPAMLRPQTREQLCPSPGVRSSCCVSRNPG